MFLFLLFVLDAVLGSCVLCFILRKKGLMTGDSAELWQPIVASVLSSLLGFFLPLAMTGLFALGIIVIFLSWATGAEWQKLIIPVLLTRFTVGIVEVAFVYFFAPLPPPA